MKKYNFVVLAIALIFNQMVYYGARIITTNREHYNWTLPIDQDIPVVQMSIIIYFGCYLFWIINYYLCSKQERNESDRFFCADFVSKIICFLLFIVLPTTNIRPVVQSNNLLYYLYQIDAPNNLFPSIHCLVSWLCWIGIRKRKDISYGYKCFSLIMAILVCISTLTTRQHVLVDVIGGIVLAEWSYWISKKIYPFYSRFITKIMSIKWIKCRHEF